MKPACAAGALLLACLCKSTTALLGLRLAYAARWGLALTAVAGVCVLYLLDCFLKGRGRRIACAAALLVWLPLLLARAVWCRETGYYTFPSPDGLHRVQVEEADSWCCTVGLRKGPFLVQPLGGYVAHNRSWPFHKGEVSVIFGQGSVTLIFPDQSPIQLDFPQKDGGL